MSEMVERVATAITLAAAASGSTGDDLIRDMAKQAIAAMREPTEAVMAAGAWAEYDGQATNAIEVWRAMIDAALGE